MVMGTMTDFALIACLCLSLCQAQGLIDPMDPAQGCSKYETPLAERTVVPADDPSNDLSQQFEQLSFRANNYGASTSKLSATLNGIYTLNIKMDSGPRPDTVKGGDLNGFYALHRTLLTLRKDSYSNEKTTTGLQMWNLYVRKNNSEEDPSALNFLSLNVDFEIGEKPNNQIDLILSALKKLTLKEPSAALSYNYDLYDFLPLQTSFGVYETNRFPFELPKAEHSDSNACGPIVKVYLFRNPLTLSKAQLDRFLVLDEELKKAFGSPTRGRNVTSTIKAEKLGSGKMYLTSLAEPLLFRRMVAEAHSVEGTNMGDGSDDDDDDEDDYDKDEEGAFDENDVEEVMAHQKPIESTEEEAFPPDCVFLYKIQDVIQGRRRGGSGRILSSPLTVLLILPILLLMASH